MFEHSACECCEEIPSIYVVAKSPPHGSVLLLKDALGRLSLMLLRFVTEEVLLGELVRYIFIIIY